MPDKIEKQIQINAPVSRVWRAITDYREFGEWFKVKLDGPFTPGETSHGKMTHPGYEHVAWKANVKEITPESLFSFTWYPYAIDPNVDYSGETPTLVEFHLTPAEDGTLLVVIESGFDKVPAHRRDEAFRMDEMGWTAQMKNIENHVAKNP